MALTALLLAATAASASPSQQHLKDRILRSSLSAMASGQAAHGMATLPERINPSPGTDRCTTMIVGPKGSADGSTMTTHTADCAECDFRLARVPAKDWPEGAMRPVYLFASAYPRRVEVGRSPTWAPENLDRTLPQHREWTKEGFSKIVGHIPQVSHTYALIEGLYGIINEHQVSRRKRGGG